MTGTALMTRHRRTKGLRRWVWPSLMLPFLLVGCGQPASNAPDANSTETPSATDTPSAADAAGTSAERYASETPDDENTQSAVESDADVESADDPDKVQRSCPNDVVVWVNTNSGVYHMPGERWYGNTQSGVYMCQHVADGHGDRQTMNGQ